jgi:ubiquitin-conjugating enzyme E2 R
VGIFGPPDTIYQGGYFKGELSFPADYPHSPPVFRFITPIPWHPNVYKVSRPVCSLSLPFMSSVRV